MAALDNHYEFLGLEPTASRDAIESAIEHVSEQAIALVYTSPQRSADLWDRIRQMRRDLLASSEGRQVYDEALLRRHDLDALAPALGRTPIAIPAERSPESRTRRAAFVAAPAPAAEPAPVPDDEASSAIAWPYALVAAAAVLVAVAGALLTHAPGASPARRPVAMKLSETGTLHDSKYVSGKSVSLSWSKVPGASLYRLQVATAPGDPPDAVVFAGGSAVVTIAGTSYQLRVRGPQVYYWRVAAKIAGTWQRYGRSTHFAVARPAISRPVALAPTTGIFRGGKSARLCWTPVQSAIAYRLRIAGRKTQTVHGTCVTVPTGAHSYRWSVAALVPGVRLYSGSYSVAAVVRVSPARHVTVSRSTRRGHRVVQSRPHRRDTSHTPSAKVTSRTAASPIEVAVRLSTAASASRIGSSSAGRRALARTSAGLDSVPRGVGSIPTRRTTAHAVPSAVRRTTTAALPRPTRTRTASVSPAPVRTRAPVRPQIPPPPAPPRSPAGAPTTTAPVPTQSVTGTGPVNSPAGIYVKPVVAPQSATSAPRATSSSGPAPTVATAHPPVPTPSTTQPTVSTAQPTDAPGHAHPEHPIHPAHPAHPSHP